MPFRRAFRRLLRPGLLRPDRARPLAAGLCLAGILPLAASDAARAGITGVCPDGSIFVVQHASAIPCRDHKQVDPGDVPPIKPEYLPRPYAWEVFRHQQDPNNPYNLVDEARKVREGGAAGRSGAGGDGAPAPTAGPPPVAAEPPPAQPPTPTRTARVERAPAPPEPQPELGLTDREVQDLFLIVHLAQRRAPATFEAEAERGVTVRLAQSSAFGPRLRNAHRELPPGPVLLFAAVAEDRGAFHGNLTFVQGHEAYQPDRADPDELGLIRGRLGEMEPDEAVLGYVVLPPHMRTEQPIDIYWNDRQLTATLRP